MRVFCLFTPEGEGYGNGVFAVRSRGGWAGGLLRAGKSRVGHRIPCCATIGTSRLNEVEAWGLRRIPEEPLGGGGGVCVCENMPRFREKAAGLPLSGLICWSISHQVKGHVCTSSTERSFWPYCCHLLLFCGCGARRAHVSARNPEAKKNSAVHKF